MSFFATCMYLRRNLRAVWPPNASLYASSTCVHLRLVAGPFDQGFKVSLSTLWYSYKAYKLLKGYFTFRNVSFFLPQLKQSLKFLVERDPIKGAFVWDQSGIRIIGVMRVSFCLGAILFLEYLNFHSGNSAARSRILGFTSHVIKIKISNHSSQESEIRYIIDI